MAAETQYTSNTGSIQITTANANLDGTGAVVSVLTAALNGTLIKSVKIKAVGATTEGMIRFFIYDGTNTRLIEEVHVSANTPSATNPAFEYTWNCNIKLKSTWVLKASTQNSETFNIIAEGLNWTYPIGTVRPESTQYVTNTGACLISTANSNLDGTGSLGTVITAGSSATYKGCRIDSITIKAIVTTTDGMVRLFVHDGTNTRLLMEIPIPAVTKSGTEQAFETKVKIDFSLKADWSLKASTQNTESFSIVAEGNDWSYPLETYITNYTPATGTFTTSEEKLHSLRVPPNCFVAGDLIWIYASLSMNNNSNAKTFRIYVNSADTLSGATLIATYAPASILTDGFSRYFPITNDTTLECFGSSTGSGRTSLLTNPGTSNTVSVPSVSAGFYVLISGQKVANGDTDTIRWSMVQKTF